MRGPSKECRKDPIVSIAMVVDRDGNSHRLQSLSGQQLGKDDDEVLDR